VAVHVLHVRLDIAAHGVTGRVRCANPSLHGRAELANHLSRHLRHQIVPVNEMVGDQPSTADLRPLRDHDERGTLVADIGDRLDSGLDDLGPSRDRGIRDPLALSYLHE
jgi:hypothetical protein